MPTDNKDLSQKTIFWTGILSITLDTQNTLFVGNPVKLVLAKIALCALFLHKLAATPLEASRGT